MPVRAALALALLVLASGCAPRVAHRLETPPGDPGTLEEGLRMRTDRVADVEAAVGYVRSDDRDHVLWVRVTNHSDRTVTLDPATFATLAFESPAAWREGDGGRELARDPEAELAAVDRRAARKKAWGTASILLGAAIGVATTVAVVYDPPDTRREAYAVDDALYTAEGLVLDGVAARRIAALEQEDGRAYWEAVLRRTTLPPNTFMDGLVHVPIDPEARVVVVEVGAGRAAVPFRFIQRTVRF